MKGFVVLVVFILVVGVVCIEDSFEEEVEGQCVQNCPLQKNMTDDEFICGSICSLKQCQKGCRLWKQALTSDCQRACNGENDRITPKDILCMRGCNDGLGRYVNQFRLRYGKPPAPALVADSLKATSLKLEWNFPPASKSALSYHVQWKYEEIATPSWQYCRNVSWDEKNIVLVQDLQPYTKYRFRVMLTLGRNEESISSLPSVVISTLPFGVPASRPVSVIAAPVDHSSISVSWEPGPFPHGPLLSYVLEFTDHHHSEVKDIPPKNKFYIIRNLEPMTNYTISVQMRNNFGAGPPTKISVTTRPESIVENSLKPKLIIATEDWIIEQGTNISDDPTFLYTFPRRTIRGVGLHINKKLLFISDDRRQVIRSDMNSNSSRRVILKDNQVNFIPLDLSVDWLNNQLYVLGELKGREPKMWQITRCSLEGEGLTVAVAGLTTKPTTMEIDPYNGFLFWVVQDIAKGGLYRLDISDVSNGIKHEVKPELILNDTYLGAFIVDHSNFRLLVASQNQNTINSVSFDGKEITNVRPRVNKAKFQKVVSLTTTNKIFYWTNGSEIFYEAYHSLGNSYYHNSFPSIAAKSYKKVLINLPNTQPWPIPVNPPTGVQAVFGCNTAKISWKVPHLIGVQGKGAWQNWSYEISITDLYTNKKRIFNNINSTSYTVLNLKENTRYSVKAAAYTSYGKGPWSSEFKGMTLNKKQNPLILWSAAEGLMKSNATGDEVEILIHKSNMRNYTFTAVSWFKDQIFLVTNSSLLFYFNTTSHSQYRITEVDSVGSIAIDWIGLKLYWSNPKQQIISRGNLNGSQQETLPIMTLAKELNIDSVAAYIYWSTGFTVECAHLNGMDRVEYHTSQFFSGKQVMGVTLDMDYKNVFWIVRGSEGSNLYRAPMAGYGRGKIVVEKVSSLQKRNLQGPLCNFHRHLIWLQDDKNAAISDLEGKNIATINAKNIYGLEMVYVMDSSLQVRPDGVEGEVIVIPEAIDKETIRVIGSAEAFNITWNPVRNINYGQVFYEMQIDDLSRNDSNMITTLPTIKYWKAVPPFTKLEISIRAFTYWGGSSAVRVKINSPPSTPSSPKNLRAFVSFEPQQNATFNLNYVSIIFRWDPPLHPNGVLVGYKISCWYLDNDVEIEICDNSSVQASKTEYIANELLGNEIYYFQVKAFTEVGDGKASEVIMVNSSHEYPLPTLLIATSDSIFIKDIDANYNYSYLNGISTPTEITYMMKERKIFWINSIKELHMFDLNTNKNTKFSSLKGNPGSLTLDWLERSLYYTEYEEMSIIYKLDLNQNNKQNEIYKTSSKILKIDVSPFTKKLYWIEHDGSRNKLMESTTDGNEVVEFFKTRSKRDIDNCNCPMNPSIADTFTTDHSDGDKKPQLIFIDSKNQNIMSADKTGCFCDIIANNTLISNTFPLQKIKSDFGTLYWTNHQGLLYALKREDLNLSTKEINVKDVSIFGQHTQPYPSQKCLAPKQKQLVVKVIQKSSSFLKLEMPQFLVDDQCKNISMATVQYRIYYIEYKNNETNCDEACIKLTTFDKIKELNGLKPFTKYLISVSIANRYTEESDVVVGPGIIVQTAAGAPSKPLNVSATVLNPTLAEVSWSPPEQLNGLTVYYEIHWKTAGMPLGVRQTGEQPVLDGNYNMSTRTFTSLLNNLSPNETYTVWVRAYSETNESSSDSDRVNITTYPEPANFLLANRTAYTLKLLWNLDMHISKYSVQYVPITSNDWRTVEAKHDDHNVIVAVGNLQPKTQYKFRLSLYYKKHGDPYDWPSDSRFTFETLGDRPSPPGTPIIQYVKPEVYKVYWEAAKDNGAPIELYRLEALKIINYRTKRSTNRTAWFETAPSIEEMEYKWETFYNGTDTSWIISNLSDEYKYAFRVSALNVYGWSDPSKESAEFDLNEAARMAEKQNPLKLAIAIAVPVTVCLLVILICISYKKCMKPKKIQQVIQISPRPDVELATLRELPRRGVHNTNVLYVATLPTPEEITLLPHIRRDQITLTKFLGSGAFGEVFEGKARGILGSARETKVAVKTLKKGASDQEKSEFLQEAQLMSHFKHEHILQLLGVCLDNDPHFIIMELMQGGDLLTYLRSSRKASTSTPSLTLIELLKMCVDVAKGCRYLEEMHFVHRDLACRNCLVSSVESESRIVKIGDFGLARDIYKNDYYRKEGQGLLPVRWMAPESLVDGVFTSQSDAWAFGVLLWEIMTLGQQPYPARNNMEVLDYVREGGRLGKPTDCPEDLHNLMLKCWEFVPDKRPTFKHCLEVLERLHLQKLKSPTTGVHQGQYISSVPDRASWKNDHEETPFLPETAPGEIPKYLELVYEPETLENDGYEIPNQMLPNGDAKKLTTVTPVQQNGAALYHNMEGKAPS